MAVSFYRTTWLKNDKGTYFSNKILNEEQFTSVDDSWALSVTRNISFIARKFPQKLLPCTPHLQFPVLQNIILYYL